MQRFVVRLAMSIVADLVADRLRTMVPAADPAATLVIVTGAILCRTKGLAPVGLGLIACGGFLAARAAPLPRRPELGTSHPRTGDRVV
ncbi:MAG: hypothetical protein ACRYG4_22175 [Janthinobacterium lividum]